LLSAALALLSGFIPLITASAQQAGAGAPSRQADERNPDPAADGIHDASLEGTQLLQSPREAFADFPKANSGNYVNWTDALNSGKTAPRFYLTTAGAKPAMLNLDVVRRVKAGPPAIFPHAAHAQWLDCPICHPALFVAKKGANSMSMSEIMLGKKCGVCHGTVAFPAAECRRCHYEPKPEVKTVTNQQAPKAARAPKQPRQK